MLITLDMLKGLRKSGLKPGEYQCNCPVCGESTFYVNLINKKYICFRESCGIHGILESVSDYDSSYSLSLSEIENSINSLFSKNDPVKEINLNKFSVKLDKKLYPYAYGYIKNRKFSDYEIEKYNVRVGISYYDNLNKITINKWKNRIIFPFYDSNIPIYAIGRTYSGMKPKYLNTIGEKSVIVYNIDNIKNRTCIICEGLISSIAAERYSGISAVCLLGCTMSDYQFYQIRSSIDKVYVSLDGGVNSSSICKKFSNTGCKTYLVDLPIINGKGIDPDECGPDYKHYIDNAKEWSII